MSTRPANLDGYLETSFEDTELSFNKSNRSLIQDAAPDSVTSLNRSRGVLPTPSSISSRGTTFSNTMDKRLSVGSGSRTDEEGEEDEEDFLNDFQEFQGKKEDLDDAFKVHFQLNNSNCVNDNNSRNGKRENADLSNDFNEKLNLHLIRGGNSNRIRQQHSMSELKLGISNNFSTGDLGIDPKASVKGKKSMSALPNFNSMVRKDNELLGDKLFASRRSIQRSLDNFEEGADEGPDDKDFVFTESLIQPQYITKSSPSPVKLSLSQYDIIRDEALLTPRLHRRHRDWNGKDQLDLFKERTRHEQSQQEPRQRRKHFYHSHYQRPQTPCRIKIIRQEIDQHIPIKNGRMCYNPKTLKWEGNEQVLDKFDKVESQDEKPLLIRERHDTHGSLSSTTTYGLDIDQTSKGMDLNEGKNNKYRNKKIVGRMMFDEENLKWVSANEDEEQEDPFVDIQDIAPPQTTAIDENENTLKASSYTTVSNNTNILLRSQSQIFPRTAVSSDSLNLPATRYHSIAFSKSDDIDPQFQLNSKELEKFWHEENRWNRKVSTWFIMGDSSCNSNTHSSNLKDLDEVKNPRSFMYEIRNMVLNSTR